MNTQPIRDERFLRGERDYPSLATNFERMHWRSMPPQLELEVVTMIDERKSR